MFLFGKSKDKGYEAQNPNRKFLFGESKDKTLADCEAIRQAEQEQHRLQAVRLAVLTAAMGEYGVKEVSGPKNNPRVLKYHAATKLKAGSDAVAWCSSFVNWVVQQVSLKSTESAAARSWQRMFPNHPGSPQVGDICVFSRGTNPNQGHVAFFVAETESNIFVLGGNQSQAVNVKPYPKSRLEHVVSLESLI